MHPKAKEIIDLHNKFYIIRKKKPKEQWTGLSLKVYKILEENLREIERNPDILPDHILRKQQHTVSMNWSRFIIS